MKIFITDRFTILNICLIGLFALFLSIHAPYAAQSAQTPDSDALIRSVSTHRRVVALTFEGDTSCKDLDSILDALEERQMTATFFLSSQWIAAYPDAAWKLVNSGQELAPLLCADTIASEQEMLSLLNESEQALRYITAPPLLVRIDSEDAANRWNAFFRKARRKEIGWDCDSFDRYGLSGKEIEERIQKNVKNGSILRFTIGSPHGAEALPHILDNLLNDGYTIQPVSLLITQ